jgi:hypothetical protein
MDRAATRAARRRCVNGLPPCGEIPACTRRPDRPPGNRRIRLKDRLLRPMSAHMQKPGFLICAPIQAANMSNGILGLVQLAKTIEKLGRTAYMCQSCGDDDETICSEDLNKHIPANGRTKTVIETILQTANQYGVKLLTDFTRARIDASYVVYPENVLENPMGAKNVVRYFLNRDGILKNGAKVKVDASDFILTHSKVMRPDAQHVCHFSAMNPLFNRDNTALAQHRKLDITYVGKGALYGYTGKVAHTVEITRNSPATKEELAAMLRNCRFFYSADACSHINNEALSCGAIPVFIHNGPWTDAEIDSFEGGTVPRVRLNATLDENFFTRFEADRDLYLKRMQACEQRWEPSVQEMIEKVDRHFDLARSPKRHQPTRSFGSRKHRKRG